MLRTPRDQIFEFEKTLKKRGINVTIRREQGMILMQPVVNFGPRSAKKRRGDFMRAIFKTDRGKVRQHNEDNGGIFINSEGVRLAIVADGMGGHRAGDVASAMTIDISRKAGSNQVGIETAK